ncbi:Uncharacterised protein [Streptococcus anginosus]|uniref:Uncharacterized protein n=1 Tax=Streptococcus anginosus TaxID=1328 RepID=A0A4V0AAR2_STRAP|nr:hypothetical protein [Streptococcus anginosus]VTS50558.1 Uncharacterised protein [Streptococcus anginosus]
MRIKKIYQSNTEEISQQNMSVNIVAFMKIDSGYDDANYHNNVVPNMECEKCGKKAEPNYRPLAPKYPEGYQI